MEKIRSYLYNNRLVVLLYKFWFYFGLGRGQFGKFTDPIQDIAAVMVISQFGFGVDVQQYKFIWGLLILFAVIGVTFVGWFTKNSGLWDVEVEVGAKKNIVQNQMLQAAQKINKHLDDAGRKIK